MSDVALKKGDLVRFTVEGEISWVVNSDGYFEIGDYYYYSPAGALEIIEKPLVVGDEVTPQNAHLLSKQKYILADKDGDSWNSWPGSAHSQQTYGPFTLVYIHPESE